MGETCQFCGRDPFHYVDIGVGWEPVAVICCEAGIEHYEKQRREAEATITAGDHAALLPKDGTP